MSLIVDQCTTASRTSKGGRLVCPLKTGDWAADNYLGRRAACELVNHTRESGDVPRFVCALAAVFGCESEGGCGVKTGFTFGVATLATGGTIG